MRNTTFAMPAQPIARRQLFRLTAVAGAAMAVVGTTGLPALARDTDSEMVGAQVQPPTDPLRDISPDQSRYVSQWADTIYDAVRDHGLNPPRAARCYAYVAQTMYEAAASALNAPGLYGRSPLFGVPTRPAGLIDWQVAAAQAGSRVLVHIIGSGDARRHPLLQNTVRRRSEAGVTATQLTASRMHGWAVADLAIAAASADGVSSFPNTYDAPSGPGMWRPTPDKFEAPVEPHWGSVRTLALSTGSSVKPIAPEAFSTDPASGMYQQAREVYDIHSTLTDEQRLIADYWKDSPTDTGTPSGHWFLIAAHCSLQAGVDALSTLRALTLTATAGHDAFVSCWDAKYRHNLQRPITYINDHIDPSWRPFLETPAFPEYVSGHAVSSSAAATVLTGIFGSMAFTDHPRVYGGNPRSFADFSQAAAEAGKSRLYGGIHYQMGNVNGLDQGREIGARVLRGLGAVLA